MGISCYSGYVDEHKTVCIPSAEISSVFLLDENREVTDVFLYEVSNDKDCGIIKICEVENEIFCFERNQYKYWKFNKITRNIEGTIFSNIKGYITSAVIENKNVWLFPLDFSSPIVIVSLIDETITELQWHGDKTFINKLVGTSMIKSYYSNGYIYLANRNENNIYLIEINCSTRNIKYKKIEDIKRINAVAAGEQHVYVLCLKLNDRTIVKKYNMQNFLLDEEIEVSEYVKIHNINPLEYGRMIYFGNSLLIFSINKGDVIIVDNKKVISELKNQEGVIVKNSCYDYQLIDDECFIFSLDNKGFYRILKNNNGFVWVDESIKINEEYYTSAFIERQTEGKVLVETNNINLNSFIKSLL